MRRTVINVKAIRNSYEELGVKEFYRLHGSEYYNPHFPQIKLLLENNQHRIDYSQVLDFCCGGGEVSLVLQKSGFDNTDASDPFTQKAYFKYSGKKCMAYSFDDVIRGKLQGRWSAIICSFAMHLCEPKKLYPLVYQLFECTKQLVIITPHKRPALEKLDSVKLMFEDFSLTPKGKKVRLKSYAQIT